MPRPPGTSHGKAKQHLNGWERLFVVVSVLFLIPVGIFGMQNWPEFSPLLTEAERQLPPADLPQYKIDNGKMDLRAMYELEQVYGPLPKDLNDPLARLARSKALKTPLQREFYEWQQRMAFFKEIEPRWQVVRDSAEAAHREAVQRERWLAVGFLALAWVVPLAVLYSLARATAWVVSGFRAPS